MIPSAPSSAETAFKRKFRRTLKGVPAMVIGAGVIIYGVGFGQHPNVAGAVVSAAVYVLIVGAAFWAGFPKSRFRSAFTEAEGDTLWPAPRPGRTRPQGRRASRAAGGMSGMSKLSRFHYMAMVSPRQRIRAMVGGAVMSVVSLLLLAIGLLAIGAGSASGAVEFIVVGALGSLFFVPATIYALVGIIVLRKRS